MTAPGATRAGCRTTPPVAGSAEAPEPADLCSIGQWQPLSERCKYSAGLSPCESHSRQGHASRGRLRPEKIEPSALQCPAPAYPPAAPVPASSASRPRRLSESRHSMPGTAAGNQVADECGDPVPREASHSPAMNKITINLGSPFGSPPSLAPLIFGKHGQQPESLFPGLGRARDRSTSVCPMSSHEAFGGQRTRSQRDTPRQHVRRGRGVQAACRRLARRQIVMSP